VSKFSIKWHEECFANSAASTEELRRNVARMTVELSRRAEALTFYASQIEEAKKRGMDGFDRDRLLVKRGASK
jgi:hypothetical protein